VLRRDFRIHLAVTSLLNKSRRIAHDQRTLKGNNRVTFSIWMQTPIGAMHYEEHPTLQIWERTLP
jgi:hypothetical protein